MLSPNQQGFLLDRQTFDDKGKALIELWLIGDAGPVKLNIQEEKLVFFVTRESLPQAKDYLKDSNIDFISQLLSLKTFQHQPVAGLYFSSHQAFYDARNLLAKSNIEIFEAAIRPADRYLMERFVRGGIEYTGDPVHKNGYLEYHNARIKPCDYLPSFKLVSLDIECAADGELFSIGFYSQINGATLQQVIMRGNAKDPANFNAPNYIQWVDNESQLLTGLVDYITKVDPDIIIGWNIINFDFRVLAKRAQLNGVILKLGRGAKAMRWRDSFNDSNQGFVSIAGRMVIDGIAALKAEAYSFPSFSLQAMAQHFLGKGKLSEDVDNRLEQIVHDFNHNKPKLAAYNLQDCILVWDIFAKARLLDFLIFRSQLTGLELDRAGGSVAAFTNLYLPKLHRQGYVSPNLPADGGLASPGGYVMSSKPGLYTNVLLLDFKSLYPSIIRTFKIDPLGLVEGLLDSDYAIAGFRGGSFDRNKHLLPKIITQLWNEREQAKKDKDLAKSQAIKILMNSFYGVLGSGGCPFYDTRLASSITLRGHAIMQQTAAWIKDKGMDVIYGDTDSTFVLLDPKLSQEEVALVGKQLAKEINLAWTKQLTQEFNITSHLELEFETQFSQFFMPTIRGSELGSKKRYAGIKQTDNGPELIFKGLENVRSDWTQLARDFQQTLYQLVFNGEDPQDFILTCVRQTLAGELDDKLVYRKRLRRRLSDYVKNIPPQVKAARIADEKNAKRGLPLKYQRKGTIAYVITLTGPQPVEYQTSPIDYQHYIDKQIAPVAEAILPFVGIDFAGLFDKQIGLF